MSLKALIESAILAEGNLYLRVKPDAMKRGVTLSKGDTKIALEPVTARTRTTQHLPFRASFAFPNTGPTVSETNAEGRRVSFGIDAELNALSDWAIDNGKTVQMRVDERHEPRVITLNSSALVPQTTEPRFFEALIASHRAVCSLLVQYDIDGADQPEIVKVPFDPSRIGGRSMEGYQKVALPVPAHLGNVTVTIHVDYEGFRSEDEDNFPYLFIANPEVVDDRENRSEVQPRTLNLSETETGLWHVARVPLFESPEDLPLMLSSGTTESIVFGPEANSVKLDADYGHTLSLEALAPQTMMLYVDGRLAEPVHVGRGATPVRLPSKYMRGEHIDVSLRDMSGSQLFLRTVMLAPRILTPEEVVLRESRAPYPTDLSVRANHRYQSLRGHIENPVKGLDTPSLHTAITMLDRNYDTVKLKPLKFPKVTKPDVSVIVPAHNKVEVTYYALCALLVAANKASFEVIVVDDASTDETRELEKIVSGITVIHNKEPQRFIRACNAGVEKARGEYVVLLNNDTEVTGGWLDALIDGFQRFDNVGAVGSKLLYPNGSLQDAGGIIWGNGNPWNYGHQANPWDPRFCYARQADYLSGAAVMTTKAIWDEVGGLSSYLEPMYFEDTDFSFKIRAAGYKTYFIPTSIVYHFEGMTSGTSTASGFKRYQEVNRPKFKRRWVRDYAGFGEEGMHPDLEKDRGIVGRVLFIDYSTPREDRDAGSYAARREIELVQSLGYKVTFLPQNLAHMGVYTQELEKTGVEMIYAPFFLSVAEFLEKRASEFDAIYITRYYVAQDTLGRIRKLAPHAKVILNNADLHFLRELRAALTSGDSNRLAAVDSVREQELEMMTKVDVTLSYNEVEHAIITSHTQGQAKVMKCPWVVDIPDSVPPLSKRKGLSFLGSFAHHPNNEGVKWFCREVMPLLDGTGTHLSIYGSAMGDDIKDLESEWIDPVGFVDEIADAYDNHRIFVAPLLSGAGIKGKVLSAIAHGIPTVLTPVAAEGIGLRNKHDALIVETAQEWANAIRALSTDDAMWEAMSAASRAYAAEQFSFEAGQEKMRLAFEAVDLFGTS